MDLDHPKPESDDTVSNSDPVNDDHIAGNTGKDVRDNEYYFEMVVFKVIQDIDCHGQCTILNPDIVQVGNTIFRVPKNGLVFPGTIFEAMFSLPTVEGKAEGLNDQNPIILPVDEENFRGFLRAMYPFKWVPS